MADRNAVTIITDSRNLRALPFRPTEDQLSIGKCWEDWLESIEREFRYFRIDNSLDKKDALIIYGGPEIARLEKSLPDEDSQENLDVYQKLKTKLNSYFMPKRNKHFARYMFLKTRPEAGEATVVYASRLREKAYDCDFGDNTNERILEHLIQTIEYEFLKQRCISKGWTLQQFLAEAGQTEDISLRVHDMKADQWSKQVFHIEERRGNWTNRNSDNQGGPKMQPCSYCGLTNAHSKGRNCPAYGVQCDICRKFDHFTSVCRANVSLTETTDELQNRKPHEQRNERVRVKKTEEKCSNSELNSNDEYLAQSVGHISVKTVKELSEDSGASSPEIDFFRDRLKDLEKDLATTKKLIESMYKEQKSKRNQTYYDKSENETQNFQEDSDLLNDQYGNLLDTYSLQTGVEQPALKGCTPYTEAKIDMHSDLSDTGNIGPSEKVGQCQKLVAPHEGKRPRGYQTHRKRKRNGRRHY